MLIKRTNINPSLNFLDEIEELPLDLEMTPKFVDMVHKKFEETIMKSPVIREIYKQRWAGITDPKVKARILMFLEGVHGLLDNVGILDSFIRDWVEVNKTHETTELFGAFLFYPDGVVPSKAEITKSDSFITHTCNQFKSLWHGTGDYRFNHLRLDTPGQESVFTTIIMFYLDRDDYDQTKKDVLQGVCLRLWDKFRNGTLNDTDPSEIMRTAAMVQQLVSQKELDDAEAEYQKHLLESRLMKEVRPPSSAVH